MYVELDYLHIHEEFKGFSKTYSYFTRMYNLSKCHIVQKCKSTGTRLVRTPCVQARTQSGYAWVRS
jgi:hypothetical protein